MKGRLLVVDDEQSTRRFLQILLRREGYEVTTCASGWEAVQRAMAEEFDVVLLDICMPGLSGIDALREIKKIKPNLPVVMVTAVMDPARGMEAMDQGAADYVVKPVQRDRLVNLLSFFSFVAQ